VINQYQGSHEISCEYGKKKAEIGSFKKVTFKKNNSEKTKEKEDQINNCGSFIS